MILSLMRMVERLGSRREWEVAVDSPLDLSVIICTRDRAESLSETLESLAAADRNGIDIEVVVVDNGSADNTREVVDRWCRALPIRYVMEPEPGLGAALNAGISQPGLGGLVAVLDDDITVDMGWFQGVCAISDRWPEHDVFCGRIVTAWPPEGPPASFDHPSLSWVFSALDYGEREEPLFTRKTPIPSGIYWFRGRILDAGVRYKNIWLAEADLMVRLAEAGYTGMAAPDAVVHHRIQDVFLTRKGVRQRAIRVFTAMPHVLLLSPKTSRKAVLLRDHPILFRCACAVGVARWGLRYLFAGLKRPLNAVFPRRVVALGGIVSNIQGLLHAGEIRQRAASLAARPIPRRHVPPS